MKKTLHDRVFEHGRTHLEQLIARLHGFSHKVYVDETGTNVVAAQKREA